MPALRRKPVLLGEKLQETPLLVVDPQYQAGACNIGPEEIRRRMLAGHVGLAVSVALLVVLIAIHAAPIARFVVALTMTGAASGYIQARLRFCANYGSRGVYNFGKAGHTTSVADRAARARDRFRSMQIGVASGAIGLACGIVAVLLPV
jgi:hypothetical protein